jgi:hypothetical protein
MDRDVLVTKLALLKTLRKSASRRLALAAGEPKCRKPITGPCCALMGSGNATAALPTSVMNSRVARAILLVKSNTRWAMDRKVSPQS